MSWRRQCRQVLTAILGFRKGKALHRKTGCRLLLEALEDRMAPAAVTPAANAQLSQRYWQMPISFEVNAGQTDAQVRYLAHGSGYALFLTSTGAVLNLENVAAAGPTRKPSDLKPDTASASMAPASVTGVALATNLVGANPEAAVAGLDQLPGTSNYFIGNDPSQWHTNIANYAQVRYQDVYPGVNLVYYGNQQQLEYDFVVAPGADPGSIRFSIQGADRLRLDANGNLVLSTALGDVLEHAPVVYQEAGGVRQAVVGQFVLLNQDEVGFQVGAYDPNLPLTIDPVLSYSTYLGSTAVAGYGIAVDSAGNAYITGGTYYVGFPVTAGAFQTSGGGYQDTFVTKLNAAGTALLYSTYLGGSGFEDGNGISVDSAGNAYVTGFTNSTNFPVTAGAFQTTFGGVEDAFLAKLNAAGTALLYSTYLGGNGDDFGNGIAVDSAGNAYVTGYTNSTNFPVTAGAFQTTYGGSLDAFMSKLNAAGTALLYSTYLGGNGDDFGNGIAVDSAGNAYVTGGTSSANFPVTASAFQTTYGGGYYDAFVTKLNAAGTVLIYSTYLGGNDRDIGNGIAVDSAGNAYVTGDTSSANVPVTAGALQTTGINDAFVTELNAAGTALLYGTYLGGGNDGGNGIAVDSAGNAYVTGGTSSANFPVTASAFQTTFGGVEDAFLAKVNAAGTALLYSTYLGGNDEEYGNGIAVDSAGNAYVTGQTVSTNFPVTAGAFQTTFHGNNDAFVAKFTFVSTLPAIHFQIAAPATATFGTPGVFSVTALDQNDEPTTGYTGTIHFNSTDASALLPTDMPLTNGTGTFNVTFNTFGPQTISATDTVSPGITGTSNPIIVSPTPTQFEVSAPSNVTAGTPFLVTVTAEDAGGHLATGYTGTVHLSASGGNPVLPADAALTNGVGTFLVTFKIAGTWIVTATDTTSAGILGSSGNVVVGAGAASYFAVIAPATTTTGDPVVITLTALDQYGNTATGYSGKVHFTSSDPAAGLPADAPLTNGTSTFQATINTAGSQTFTATDNAGAVPTITGTSAAITTRGLVVTSFAPAAGGFTATFSKAFDPSKLTLYGSGQATVQDVTLISEHNGPIPGTVYVDPSDQSITFKATESYLEAFFGTPVLADDTYSVTLVSGTTNGFTDGSAGLDGANNASHANYTTTFTTANQSKTILSLPDFARGPDGSHNILLPNDIGHGIPVTLTNATMVSEALFSLNYNPALLTVTGASSADATGGGTLTLVGAPNIIDASHATANFQYTNTTPQSGTVILDDIVASVPDGAASKYKAKELLSLTSITVNGSAFTGVATSAVHVNAYFGDVTGNGSIDALDVAFANSVAQGNATGFIGYPLLDPAIIGDVAGDISVDAGDVSTLAAYVSQLPTPKIPAIPTGLTIAPTGPDPTLNLAEAGAISPRSLRVNGGVVNISVQLDQPHPAGSSGMTEAILALKYDPSVLSLSQSDITLGSIPGLGTGWQLTSVIDQITGQIAITLYSATPVSANNAGSLVNIAFHINPASEAARFANVPLGSVQLASSVSADGEQFTTQVDDPQGQFVLSPGLNRLAFGMGRNIRALSRKTHASS
jgi:hypothetical protein